MNLTLRDILVIRTINEEGSLTQAAEQLFISQSALSHQLKKIEKAIQAEVFHRMNKELVLTSAGQRILQSSEPILAELNQLYTDLEALNKGESGTIRISTECYTCYHWLPPIIMAFQEQYPKAEIKVISEATRQPMDYLSKAKLDVAIVSDLYNEHPYQSHHLFEDEMRAVLSTQHRLAGKARLTPEDFTGETVILYDVPDDDLFFLREFIKPNGIQLKQVMKLELTEAIVEMVAAGMGIAIMANWAVAGYLKSKNLTTKPIAQKPILRHWYATTFKQEQQPMVRHFIQFLKSWNFN